MLNNAEHRMKKSLQALKEELACIRTGRASIALLDHVMVPYYGADVPLNQVANLSVPEARTVVISPWEKNLIPVVEKAIMTSDLGITPGNDGEVIRLNLPELTEERRHELVRQVKKLAEQDKVAIRNIRRDANDKVRAQVRDKDLPEDEGKRLEEKIQRLTDRYVGEVDKIVEHKEQDILTV